MFPVWDIVVGVFARKATFKIWDGCFKLSVVNIYGLNTKISSKRPAYNANLMKWKPKGLMNQKFFSTG